MDKRIIYIKVQNNDRVKDEYCKNKNIKLIRIPYTKYQEVDSILNLNI